MLTKKSSFTRSFHRLPKVLKPPINKTIPMNSEFSFGVGTLKNTKGENLASEDRIIENLEVGDTGISIFGVIDGHGGEDCADFCANALPKVIQTEVSKRNLDKIEGLLDESWGTLLEDSFRQVAFAWDSVGKITGGAVATLVLVSKRTCLIAHAGDCKVLASLPGNSFVELTRDHRCSDPDEVLRVEQAGGVVFNGRVEGRLMPSRAFGDINVRTRPNGTLIDCIAPEPDICYHLVDDDRDGFLIVASDGLFDALSPSQAVSQVRKSLEQNNDPRAAANDLLNFASKKTTDDVSVVVISFRKLK